MSVPSGVEAMRERLRVFAGYDRDLHERADVVVVGSGPAGAVVAYELAAAGRDVVLVEEGPPFTPGEARLESASAATLVPTIDFHVTAPRAGYMMEAPSMAAAEASLVQATTFTPSSDM